jgi:ribosome-associated toxin RatA of RatAB toxin-antitoxin module
MKIMHIRNTCIVIATVLFSVFLLSPDAFCISQEPEPAAVQSLLSESCADDIAVSTTNMDDGITAVTGRIHINASPDHVWSAITDYDNQKHFVPKLLDSGLISDNGSEQVMFEKGKTGFLLFSKTVYIKMSIRGDYLRRLSFRQIEGDFKIYEGDWMIERLPDGKGSVLTFSAKIKPDFFAPAMFVRKVQQKDLPMVLAAMKKRAEASSGKAGFAGMKNVRHDTLLPSMPPPVVN